MSGQNSNNNGDLGSYMPKNVHDVFVRESGPGAWGASIRVKKGCLVRRSSHGEWYQIEEDCTLFMEYEDSYLEVFTPGESKIDVYKAYGD